MIEVARGKLVIIRIHEPADFNDEAVWAMDPEVVALDPPAGESLNAHPYAIDTVDRFHIGVCNLYDHNTRQSSIQLGIRIGVKSYWNRGYGTDAVRILTEFAFDYFQVNRIWLKVLPQNIGAIRCYEKCGFVYIGMLELSGYSFQVMETVK